MANPPNAFSIPRPIDPKDIERCTMTLTQGSAITDLLLPGEGVASYTLTLTAEAVAAGLQIKTDSGYATTLVGLILAFWVEVDTDMQTDPMFDGAGVALGFELTIVTDSTPARRKQKTVTLKVAQQ